MYDPSLERLIEVSLADGILTEKEKEVICKKAASFGIDRDEIMVYVEGLLDEKKKSQSQGGKYGVIHTCPNCGAHVNPTTLKCEECGYIFDGVEASEIIKQFEEKVSNANMFTRAKVIKLFPVPNTQESLLAMIEYLHPLCNSYGGATISGRETSAYQTKFKECLTRAKIAFPNHPKVLAYKDLEKKRKRKVALIVTICLIFLLVPAVFGIYYGLTITNDEKEVDQYKESKDLVNDTNEIDETTTEENLSPNDYSEVSE